MKLSILITFIELAIIKFILIIYSLTVERFLKSRRKSKLISEMKKAKTLDDFIAIAMRYEYEYPIAWAGYQIMKREERKERRKQEKELQENGGHK
jgi:hypothetical protein